MCLLALNRDAEDNSAPLSQLVRRMDGLIAAFRLRKLTNQDKAEFSYLIRTPHPAIYVVRITKKCSVRRTNQSTLIRREHCQATCYKYFVNLFNC